MDLALGFFVSLSFLLLFLPSDSGLNFGPILGLIATRLPLFLLNQALRFWCWLR